LKLAQLEIILLPCSKIKDTIGAINQASPFMAGQFRSEGLIFLS
jgi:hypothetical protein